MKNFEISERQMKIISLKEKGYTFEQIGKEVGMTAKLANVNYCYAKQKISQGIPNKETVLSNEQKEKITDAVINITNYLRDLKNLDSVSDQENMFDPKDLINICNEMADKVGMSFDENEFM